LSWKPMHLYDLDWRRVPKDGRPFSGDALLIFHVRHPETCSAKASHVGNA
jgi:hypothetical protein